MHPAVFSALDVAGGDLVSLWAAKAARTSAFSRFGTLTKVQGPSEFRRPDFSPAWFAWPPCRRYPQPPIQPPGRRFCGSLRSIHLVMAVTVERAEML